MNATHHYMLSIPLNVRDLNTIEIPWEEIQFEDYQITQADYENLFALFCQFDKPFDIIIDEYEEEEIPADKIQTAIEMAETYASKSPIEIKASTEKLLVALNRAKELGKPLELFF